MGKPDKQSLLRDVVEHKDVLMQRTAITDIVASLYQGERTFHSLSGIRVDHKDSSKDESSSRTSKFGRRLQRAELMRKLALISVDKASMMEGKLFDRMDFILKELWCSWSRKHHPQFGVITIVLTGEYLQLLPFVPSRRN